MTQRPMYAKWLISLIGTVLTDQERQILMHPIVAGVVLFSENYHDRAQLVSLITEIKCIKPDAWICVDQEGGRVTRFKGQDYGADLLDAESIGKVYRQDAEAGLALAWEMGALNGQQLKSVGVGALLGPVVDIYRGGLVLSERCFGADAQAVASLAGAYIAGLSTQGLQAVIKHFPGHGAVVEDTHVELASVNCTYEALETDDLIPFRQLLDVSAGVMCAHVSYPKIDSLPASFSRVWMRDVLRDRWGYRGLIVSDCLSMVAARLMTPIDALQAVSDAGCDLIILSHVSDLNMTYRELLDQFEWTPRLDACHSASSLQ